VYLNTATVTLVNVYITGPVCVYLNTATVTLVNLKQLSSVCQIRPKKSVRGAPGTLGGEFL
jgi:hypothetical protein